MRTTGGVDGPAHSVIIPTPVRSVQVDVNRGQSNAVAGFELYLDRLNWNGGTYRTDASVDWSELSTAASPTGAAASVEVVLTLIVYACDGTHSDTCRTDRATDRVIVSCAGNTSCSPPSEAVELSATASCLYLVCSFYISSLEIFTYSSIDGGREASAVAAGTVTHSVVKV